MTDGFAGLVARCHRFDLATLETFLVRGRVFAIAVQTDGFAGLVASLHRFDLATLETFLVRGGVSVTSHLIAVQTDGFAGLVARCHRFDLATLETFLVRGRISVTSHPIAVRTDGFAGLVASMHRFDPATLETFLVRGRVSVTSHLIAVRTDGFAGLTVFMDGSALSTDITSILHGYTSFRFLDFGKSKFRSPDLTIHSTLLLDLRQAQNANRNSFEFLFSKYLFIRMKLANSEKISEARAGKNSFLPTPFFFARLLEAPSGFFGRRDLKLGGVGLRA